MGQWV